MPDLWVGGADNGKLGVACEVIAFSIVLPCWLCYLPQSVYLTFWDLNAHALTGGTDFSDASPLGGALGCAPRAGRGGGGGVSCSF